MSAAPPLPARPASRRQDTIVAQDEADPPPAYEAYANPNEREQTVEYGPSRPFQPPPPAPPRLSHVAPPQFPFWNGSSLTPQQTGFSEGPVQPFYGAPQQPPFQSPQSTGYAPHQPQPTGYAYAPPHSFSPPTSPAGFIPPSGPPPIPNRPPPQTYSPTTVPTAGQPLLNQGRLLVYPVGQQVCHKCSNTGYKPFVGGRPGDDPSHPCRKDWRKYGRPYSGALAISAASTPTPPNYQRPLRLPPASFMPQQQQYQRQPSYPQYHAAPVRITDRPPPPGPNVLVLRPGDPRMGGVLCRRCGGDGLVCGFLFQETCDLCRGAGRLF